MMRRTLMATLVVLLAATVSLAGSSGTDTGDGSTLTEQQQLQIAAVYQQACEDAAQAQTTEQRRLIWQKMLQDIEEITGEPIQDRTRQQDSTGDRTRLQTCDPDCEARQERTGGTDETPNEDCDCDRVRDRDRDCVDDEDPEDPAETMAALTGSAMMLDTIELTGEQAGEVEQLCKETADRLRERIREVLTDEQNAALEMIREQIRLMDGIMGDDAGLCDNKLKLRMLEALELSEEQMTFILDTLDAARILLAEAETPEERQQIIADTRELILSVLTDEQLALLDSMMEQLQQQRQQRDGTGESVMARMMKQLGLTEEQEGLIEEILDEGEAAAEEAETAAEQRQIKQQVQEQIMAVLNEDQQDQLQQMLRTKARQKAQDKDMARICEQLQLTEDQEALLQQICEQTRLKLEAAETPQEKRQIMQQARQQIMEMLTDEQIQQLDQLRERTRDRDPDGTCDQTGPGQQDDSSGE